MTSSLKPASIFISYSWADKDQADQVEKDLGQMGVKLVRDVRDVTYKESISDFMKSIRDTDYALIMISDNYLKSRNCMTEILHLLKERDYASKILPVIVGPVKIYDPVARLSYTMHWNDEKNKLESALKDVSATAALSSLRDLQIIESIHSQINEFLGFIADIKHLTFEELRGEGYRSVFEAIGYKDITNLVELLTISLIKDIDKKEMELDNWFEKHPPTSDAYSIRAGIARDKGQIERAKASYEKALGLNAENAVALNNYGYLLLKLGAEPEKTRELFETAVRIMPDLTEARLNLGCILTDHFGEFDKAKEQYETIIQINPTEERAYNNLANLLKSQRPFSKKTMTEVCKLYEQALELNPKYAAAHLGYGNYLCDFIGNFDLAEYHFKEAIGLNTNMKKLAEAFLDRNNKMRQGGVRHFESGKPCPCRSGLNYEECCMDK